MTLLIYPGNPHSQGAKALAQELGIKRIKHHGSRWKPKAGDVVINWGAVECPNFFPAIIINPGDAIHTVSNKLFFFREMAATAIEDRMVTPAFHETKEAAAANLQVNGGKMVCRTILNGSGGAGIVIVSEASQLVDAPLYVRYVPKKSEWRVHVMNGKIICIQEKARRLDVPSPNWLVRNLENGFVYKRNNIDVPECVKQVALRCMENLSINFGGVDLVYNAREDRAYCLEVNSAPGIQGQTVKDYAQAFRDNFLP